MISILIPTMNRSEFLIRTLAYYAQSNFQGCLHIGDSSNRTHVEQMKSALHRLKGKLNVQYHECPGVNPAECMMQLKDLVSTPYVAFAGDDDYLVPGAIEKCIQFLENKNNTSYCAAHGHGIAIILKTGRVYGPLDSVSYYRQTTADESSSSQRLITHLGHYSVSQFSVHRLDAWQAMYKNVRAVPDMAFASELLPSTLSVTQGKIKNLDCLYLGRQVHGERYIHRDLLDWITHDEWLSSYKVFRDSIVEEMIRHDGITPEEAQKTVKHAFWLYLTRAIIQDKKPFSSQEGKALFRTRLKNLVRRVPPVHNAWKVFRRQLSKEGRTFSLSTLLHSTSPYHADFMPIYRSMTSRPESEGVS